MREPATVLRRKVSDFLASRIKPAILTKTIKVRPRSPQHEVY
jgi:hypothetical protein